MWTPLDLMDRIRVARARRRLALCDEQGANREASGQPRQSIQTARRASPSASSHRSQRSSLNNHRSTSPDDRLARTDGGRDMAYSTLLTLAAATGTHAEDQKPNRGFIAEASKRVRTVRRLMRGQRPRHEGGLLDPPSVVDLPRHDTSPQARSIQSNSSHASLVSVRRPLSIHTPRNTPSVSRRQSREFPSTRRSGDQRSGQEHWSDIDLTASGELVPTR